MYIDTIGFRFRVLCTSYEYDSCANLKCKRADFLNAVPLKVVASFEALHIPNWLIKTKNIFFCHIHLFTYYKVANKNNREFNDLTAFNKGMCQVLKHLCVTGTLILSPCSFTKFKTCKSCREVSSQLSPYRPREIIDFWMSIIENFKSGRTLLHVGLLDHDVGDSYKIFLICTSKFHNTVKSR